jgi:hypothetical protein
MMVMMQVLNQDETPLLYSLVFGEGVVNDATSVVLFNAIKSFDLEQPGHGIALQFFGNFLYLFIASTMLGFLVTLLPSLILSRTQSHTYAHKDELSISWFLNCSCGCNYEKLCQCGRNCSCDVVANISKSFILRPQFETMIYINTSVHMHMFLRLWCNVSSFPCRVVYLVHTLSKNSILEGNILEFKKCF